MWDVLTIGGIAGGLSIVGMATVLYFKWPGCENTPEV